jgi:hypothetical protein
MAIAYSTMLEGEVELRVTRPVRISVRSVNGLQGRDRFDP